MIRGAPVAVPSSRIWGPSNCVSFGRASFFLQGVDQSEYPDRLRKQTWQHSGATSQFDPEETMLAEVQMLL
jgi:hypothetical protein